MNNFIKLGIIAVIGLFFTSTPSNANEPRINSRVCVPDSVAVFSNRIHVKCKPDPKKAFTKDIRYYAMAIASRNSKQVDYTLQVLLGAQTSNKKLRIWFDTHDYKSVPGCQGSDCRKLTGAAIY